MHRDEPIGPATQDEKDQYAERVAQLVIDRRMTEDQAKRIAQAEHDQRRGTY